MFDVNPTGPEVALPQSTPAYIERLSDELLSMIFIYTHDRLVYEEEMNQDGYIMLKRPPCSFISHVCLRWRNVAVALRAHSAPVALRLRPGEYEPYAPELFRLVYPLIPRARSLHALHRLEEEEYQEEILRSLAEYAAPLLEELEMNLERPTIDMDGPYPVEHLFQQETPPKLRRISLSSCILRFPHTIFSSALVHLYLLDARIWTNIDEMVEFFHAVPLLESLTYFCINDGTANKCNMQSSKRYPLRCVSLSRLRTFEVQASLVAGIRIFSYLALPPAAELRFCICDNGGFQSRITDVELAEFVSLGTAILREHYAGYQEQGHHGCAVELGHTTISHLPELSVSIRNSDYSDGVRAQAAATAVYLSVPIFVRARALRIIPHGVTGAKKSITFRDLAGHCKDVERLYLSGPAPVWLEAELREDESLGSVLFPHCNEVTISQFNFAGRSGKMGHECYDIPDEFDSHLAEVLQAWSTSKGSECAFRFVLDDCRMTPRTRSIFEETLGSDRVQVVKGRIIRA